MFDDIRYSLYVREHFNEFITRDVNADYILKILITALLNELLSLNTRRTTRLAVYPPLPVRKVSYTEILPFLLVDTVVLRPDFLLPTLLERVVPLLDTVVVRLRVVLPDLREVVVLLVII